MRRSFLVAGLEGRVARAVSVALWGVSLTVMALQTVHKANRAHGHDLIAYLDAAQDLVAGRNPYARGAVVPYVYPLFLAAVLAPLTTVPRDAATLGWFVLSVASLVGAARVTVALARERGIIPSGVPLTVPLVALWFLLFDPIQSNLLNGQVNFQILLLCMLCLRYSLSRRPVGAAGSLATAIAVKINPVLLLGFLGTRGHWATIVLCLGLAAGLVLAPLALLAQGWAPYKLYLRAFVLARLGTEIPTHRNVRFSLNGVLEAVAPGWADAIWRLALGAGLPLLGVALVDLLSRRGGRQGRELWVFCLYLLAVPLVTPISEVHHLTSAFPAAGLLALASVTGGVASPARRRTVGAAAAWLLLVGGRLDRAGPHFFLALCLLGGLVAAEALARPDAEHADSGSPPAVTRA